MALLPKTKEFYDLFEAQTKKISAIVALFDELKGNYGNLSEIARRAKEIENEADKIVHAVTDGLLFDHTRVTEEKGDIRQFTQILDNVVDYLERAINRLHIYNVTALPGAVEEFTPVLKETAQVIEKAVVCLRDLEKNKDALSEYCVLIHTLENKADELNRKWLGSIMNSGEMESHEQVRFVIKMKEIIEVLESAMDESERVADALNTFKIKGGL